MSIADISSAVGVFSLPYFYQTFKKYHGKTPFAMRNHKKYIAIVRDESNKVQGLVTIEDFLEELVGEIWDEEDIVEETCIANGDGSFSFDAEVEIEDAFGFRFKEFVRFETVGDVCSYLESRI